MPVQAWKVTVTLVPDHRPSVGLRVIDDRGRLTHLVGTPFLDGKIGDAIDDWMTNNRAFAEDREHLRTLGKI